MNLYDKDDGFKQFTLTEANEVLPKVVRVTEKTVGLLDAIRKRHGLHEDMNLEEAEEEFRTEAANILEDWSREIAELGAYPKGYFTVDFKSPVPDTLFCWTLGEHTISYTHKTYERFADRIPIRSEPNIGFEESLN